MYRVRERAKKESRCKTLRVQDEIRSAEEQVAYGKPIQLTNEQMGKMEKSEGRKKKERKGKERKKKKKRYP